MSAAPRPASKLTADRLADSALILLGMMVVQRAIGFARGVFFCRWMSPEELGQWELAFCFLQLAAPLTVLGIPGTFNRFVEHYRRRDQLGAFLRRASRATALLVLAAVVVVNWQADWFAQVVFGSSSFAPVVGSMAIALVGLVALHFMTSLLMALRANRLVALVEFTGAATFALAGCLLLSGWGGDTRYLLAAYTGSCLLGVLLAAYLLRSWQRETLDGGQPLPATAMWWRIVPFAVWVWGTNWLTNVFEVVDRYMLIHFGNLGESAALVAVGNYHTARLFPLLLASIGGMLGSLLAAYLSRDWEQHGAAHVAARVNLAVKLLALALFSGGALLLVAAPWLFGWLLQGKFAGGLAVLPATTVSCIWLGLTAVAQRYLWCAEKVRLTTLSWLLALAVNVGLNLLLLPRLGLLGVVLATAAGNLAALASILLLSRWQGMPLASGTLLAVALPATLLLGTPAAVGVLLATLLACWQGNLMLSPEEKSELLDVGRRLVERWLPKGRLRATV